MEWNCCRFCGGNNACVPVSDASITSTVNKYFPLKINENDNLPEYICHPCQAQTVLIAKFFDCVLKTNDMLRIKMKATTTVVTKREIKFERISPPKKKTPESVKEALSKLTSVGGVTIHKLSGKKSKKATEFIPIAPMVHIKVEEGRESDAEALDEMEEEELDEDYAEPRTPDVNEAANPPSDDSFSDNGGQDSDEDYKPGRRSGSNSKQSTPKKARKLIQPTSGNSRTVVLSMDGPAAYVCMHCKARFSTFEQLKTHMATSMECKALHLKCKTCDKVCSNRKTLYAHSLTHKEKAVFICDECGKSYTNRFNLDNHLASAHGHALDEFGSIYRCRICDQQFTSRHELYPHMEQHSKEPVQRLCETCGKSFSSVKALQSHIRTHSDYRPHACPEPTCDKRFRSKLQVQQHLHVHTGVKTFICTYCSRAFAKKISLVQHERLHTGVQPYVCNLSSCTESFSTPAKLKSHQARVHLVVQEGHSMVETGGHDRQHAKSGDEDGSMWQPFSEKP